MRWAVLCSKTTYENVNRMINHFELECITKTYNKDCSNFIPNDDFESMFTCPPYFNIEEYLAEDANQIVVDYMASMTDDYLVELYHYLFPKGQYGVGYKGYF